MFSVVWPGPRVLAQGHEAGQPAGTKPPAQALRLTSPSESEAWTPGSFHSALCGVMTDIAVVNFSLCRIWLLTIWSTPGKVKGACFTWCQGSVLAQRAASPSFPVCLLCQALVLVWRPCSGPAKGMPFPQGQDMPPPDTQITTLFSWEVPGSALPALYPHDRD